MKCNVHAWMTAYIFVSEHPFAAVTGPEGRFELKGLPPGQHVIRFWHESLGSAELQVEVPAGAGLVEIEHVFSGR